MALNVWGMPAKVGSEDKELRIKVGLNIFFFWPSSKHKEHLQHMMNPQAIGEYIAKAEFDVYLLAELWMRPDHATIEASLPEVSIIANCIFWQL